MRPRETSKLQTAFTKNHSETTLSTILSLIGQHISMLVANL